MVLIAVYDMAESFYNGPSAIHHVLALGLWVVAKKRVGISLEDQVDNR